jgi:hypothetical protein
VDQGRRGHRQPQETGGLGARARRRQLVVSVGACMSECRRAQGEGKQEQSPRSPLSRPSPLLRFRDLALPRPARDTKPPCEGGGATRSATAPCTRPLAESSTAAKPLTPRSPPAAACSTPPLQPTNTASPSSSRARTASSSARTSTATATTRTMTCRTVRLASNTSVRPHAPAPAPAHLPPPPPPPPATPNPPDRKRWVVYKERTPPYKPNPTSIPPEWHGWINYINDFEPGNHKVRK